VVSFFYCKSGKSNHQSDLKASNLKGKVWKIEVINELIKTAVLNVKSVSDKIII